MLPVKDDRVQIENLADAEILAVRITEQSIDTLQDALTLQGAGCKRKRAAVL